ncbi:MAG: hypothetical protein BGO41_09330 [Clostridiales bacterium 38-18]|nr:MAG: hypothetical protein BGO41_09330 [Clostridiales bacterium 38-18]
MNFYDRYLDLDGDNAQRIKDKFIKENLKDNKIYKFIGLSCDDTLKNLKMNAFMESKLWLTHYVNFEDVSEFKVPLNRLKVSKKTKRSIENINNLFDTLREIYDICCFTTDITEYMWENYASNHNGLCLCFEIKDTDSFFPVEYIYKKTFDLTQSAIKSIKSSDEGHTDVFGRYNKEVAILPLVYKNFSYSKEKEIRFLYSPFDDENGFFGGIISPNIKTEKKYYGCYLAYKEMEIDLIGIIIGKSCDITIRSQVKDHCLKNEIWIKEE